MNDPKRLLYSAWLKSFQGLAWQFDYAQSSLFALNDWQHPLLEANTERLIKDASFRGQFLTPADLALVNEFWDVLGNGASATIMFTVHYNHKDECGEQGDGSESDIYDGHDGHNGHNHKIQFLLHGWSDAECNAALGYLQVAPPVYTGECALNNVHTLLFRASYPVFAMAYESNRILALNAAARKLFGFNEHADVSAISAKELFTTASYKMVQKWAAKGLKAPWAGNLSFKDANGKVFLCHVRSSPQERLSQQALSQHFVASEPELSASTLSNLNIGPSAGPSAALSPVPSDTAFSEPNAGSTANHPSHTAETLLRFAFLEDGVHKHAKKTEKKAKSLLTAIDATHSLRDALTCILDAIPEADGIVFSDINARKGTVCVYGVGQSFDQMPWGKEYPYDGTIAQLIEHHKHSFLVVNNTKDSIRVIDWALFIPYGVHSYFAKGFVTRGRLRALFVITSNNTNTFARCTQTGVNSFQYIDTAFTRAIHRWRQEEQ